MEFNRIYCESCTDTMARMPDGFVDFVLTSPPYGGLRTYHGFSFSFEETAKELYRVLAPGGVVVWVVADETKHFCETLVSFKQAIFFVEACGFNLLDTMIYHKSNYAPAYPSLMRYANTFEYMFVFSKGKPKHFHPVQRGKAIKGYVNKKAYFRKKNGGQDFKLISCARQTKDAENVWTICPSKAKDAGDHPAVFPENLARDHIATWSEEGDLVYDPFMGSGTTAKAAILLGRNFLGSEISQDYCAIANARIAAARHSFVENPSIQGSQPASQEKESSA